MSKIHGNLLLISMVGTWSDFLCTDGELVTLPSLELSSCLLACAKQARHRCAKTLSSLDQPTRVNLRSPAQSSFCSNCYGGHAQIYACRVDLSQAHPTPETKINARLKQASKLRQCSYTLKKFHLIIIITSNLQ